jgi:WS/DGAT/MGAT family acyltransferase
MVDGVSATDLLSVILDSEREPEGPVDHDDWEPKPEPTSIELLTHSLSLRAASPYEAARTALAVVRGPRKAAGQAVAAGRGLLNMRGLLNPNPYSTLNGPIGPHRTWDWARARLGDIKEIRAKHGGTVNDVVLAVITNGFRELLQSRGEDFSGRVIRTLVPVSVRADSERGTYNNKVSAMFAELPVNVEDPVERVSVIHEQMQDLKSSGQAVAAERLTALGGFAPGVLLALGGRVATRLPQSSVNTVTTNVPGPQKPLYLAGRRMLEAFPFVPLGGHVRVGIAIFSYDGGINFGVTGDRDSAPDVDVLCKGIERGVAELLGKPTAPKRSGAPTEARQAKSAV